LLGLIAVVDDRPIVEDEMPKTLLTIFAARAAAELERLQTENSYQNIIENVSEGVFQSTPEGHFLIANPAMARLLGYDDPDELVQSISDLSHQIYVNPSDRLAWQRSLAQDKPVIGYEAQVYRKDGTAVWVVLNIRGVFDQDGALLYYEGTMQDVTERKRNEVTIQHLFEQTERRLKYVQALRDIDQAITSSLDLKMTLSLVVEQVVAQLNVNASSILLLNPHSQVLTYASSSGFRSNTIQRTRLRLGESCAGRAAYTRELVAIPDVRLEPEGQTLRAIVTGDDFKAYYGAPLIARGQVKGVLEIFHRTELAPDEEWLNFLETLARQAAIAIDNASLFEDLQRSNLDLVMAYDATIEGWSRALDLRDRETEGHTQRVADMTERLAVRMGMGEAALVHIRRGALLHDIGKMGIPDRILLKPTTLNEEEWTIMRQHPGLAYEMLHPIAYLRPAIDIPYCHHEKWDGTGYPRGLKAEQIPAAARVFAIADVWDALTSDRPYRQAWSKEKAAEHIRFQSGANFDPQVVDHFLQLLYEDGLL
ncbi:MAG TPA: HD domain-containing protein, partial [Anaerolineales bacterium]|nr:HD domain-containing protein [Anaerolineales bacterium]